MMELWDAYDQHFNKIEGITLVRGEEHMIPEGVFHLVCDILVKHMDGTYLIMQRDSRKSYGGMWEATAGGSALQGESPIECAIRELREETGIVTSRLTEVGRVVNPDTHSAYVEFLCETDWDKENVVLQEGETVDFRWVERDKLLHMKKNELVTQRMQRFIEELQKKDMTVACDRWTGYTMRRIEVVAAIIQDGAKIFATQRGYGEFKGGWEFPGGKMEQGETPEQALMREIKEELDTDIEVGELLDTVEYDYPNFHLTMHCFLCTIKSGELVLKEHEAAKWLTKETLGSVDWLPADLGLLDKLRDIL